MPKRRPNGVNGAAQERFAVYKDNFTTAQFTNDQNQNRLNQQVRANQFQQQQQTGAYQPLQQVNGAPEQQQARRAQQQLTHQNAAVQQEAQRINMRAADTDQFEDEANEPLR